MLEAYLQRYDGPETNYAFHLAVAARILAFDSRIQLPHWLVRYLEVRALPPPHVSSQAAPLSLSETLLHRIRTRRTSFACTSNSTYGRRPPPASTDSCRVSRYHTIRFGSPPATTFRSALTRGRRRRTAATRRCTYRPA
jgi:hypothetical protein